MSAFPEPDEAVFAPASRRQWRERVAATLARRGVSAGGEPERELAGRTDDGIEIRALYVPEDLPDDPPDRGAPGADPGRPGDWDVRTRHADPDPARTNQAIHDDLAGGADSLWLVVGDGGLAVEHLADALSGVELAGVPVALDAGDQTDAAARALLGVARSGAGRLGGTLGADPIGLAASTGERVDLGVLARTAALAAGHDALGVACVDATVFHDAGASDAQEIALATAAGVAYLRALDDAGLGPAAALRAVEFRFAVTDDQFAGIAKLRAARRLWARVAELCAVPAARQRQHAVSSAAMLTRSDPWVNMLRGSVACAAAAFGGAEAITVLPFDHALGRPDASARRLARNTSTILQQEAALSRVADPGAGSWYVDTRSDALARAAWAVFTGIERDGGAVAAVESGRVDALIEPMRTRRREDVAHRRMPITGVSEYARADEQPVHREPAPAPRGGGLPRVRHAAQFEALRERADAAAARPRVFLAALGGPAEHSAATGFAAGLFAAGGIETVTGRGSSDELVEQWRAADTGVACLCSSAAHYAEHAAAEAAALKAAGVGLLWLVGEPGERLDTDLCAGVDGYLHDGCDAVAALSRTLDALGVRP